jgi:sulfite reductase (ferredoxin)
MKTESFYRIPESVAADIEQHASALKDFRAGVMDPLKFKIARVARGIYEQRDKDTYMMRIRLAAGGFTGRQMKKIAQICRDYGNLSIHVTDRQDVQLHGVDLDQTPQIMRELLTVGLTTKGGGGNTVRNITACWAAGVCCDEVFDVTPYAIGLTEYMIKDPASYNLPRKYKIAFSGCGKDCAFATVNDLGLIAAKEKRDGKEVHGFRAYVAGGMGAYSRVGEFFQEFVPAEEIGYMAEAIKRFFDKHGNRKNKHKARLRFVMDRYGVDKFKEIYQQELDDLKSKEEIVLDIRPIKEGQGNGGNASSPENGDDFLQWKSKHTQSQKDERFSLVEVGLPIGLISADQLEKLGDLADRFSGGDVRTNHNQNLSLRWVSDPGSLYTELRSAGFDLGFGGTISDVICCPLLSGFLHLSTGNLPFPGIGKTS